MLMIENESISIDLQHVTWLPTLHNMLESSNCDDDVPIELPLSAAAMRQIVHVLKEPNVFYALQDIPEKDIYKVLQALNFLGAGPLYDALLQRLKECIKLQHFQAEWLQ
jgi:hypothetical protein